MGPRNTRKAEPGRLATKNTRSHKKETAFKTAHLRSFALIPNFGDWLIDRVSLRTRVAEVGHGRGGGQKTEDGMRGCNDLERVDGLENLEA